VESKISGRRVIAIVFAAAIAYGVAHYDELLPNRWHAYTAPDGSFSIELPGKIDVEPVQAPSGDGHVSNLNMLTANPRSTTAYSCTYVEDPGIGKKTALQVLESARDGSLAKIQGTVVSQSNIEVQGHPGLEWHARARADSLVDSRIIVVGNRLYMIMAVVTAAGHRDT
jgi:hypothetical protein